MTEGSEKLKIYKILKGKLFDSDLMFMEQLSSRLKVREVTSVDESDVIMVFVPVASRAGTDINAALQEIPHVSRLVVLVVLHHTFDPYFVTPESGRCVSSDSGVFTVDCLFHEDQGLLRCERNSEALEKVTEHLKSNGASSTLQEGFKSATEKLNCKVLLWRRCVISDQDLWQTVRSHYKTCLVVVVLVVLVVLVCAGTSESCRVVGLVFFGTVLVAVLWYQFMKHCPHGRAPNPESGNFLVLGNV